MIKNGTSKQSGLSKILFKDFYDTKLHQTDINKSVDQTIRQTHNFKTTKKESSKFIEQIIKEIKEKEKNTSKVKLPHLLVDKNCKMTSHDNMNTITNLSVVKILNTESASDKTTFSNKLKYVSNYSNSLNNKISLNSDSKINMRPRLDFVNQSIEKNHFNMICKSFQEQEKKFSRARNNFYESIKLDPFSGSYFNIKMIKDRDNQEINKIHNNKLSELEDRHPTKRSYENKMKRFLNRVDKIKKTQTKLFTKFKV